MPGLPSPFSGRGEMFAVRCRSDPLDAAHCPRLSLPPAGSASPLLRQSLEGVRLRRKGPALARNSRRQSLAMGLCRRVIAHSRFCLQDLTKSLTVAQPHSSPARHRQEAGGDGHQKVRKLCVPPDECDRDGRDDVPLKTRQHRLGHANIETTMTHLTHRVDADGCDFHVSVEGCDRPARVHAVFDSRLDGIAFLVRLLTHHLPPQRRIDG